MTSATATADLSPVDTLFLKVAIAKKEMAKKDAQQVLRALKTNGGSAGAVAEKLGFLTASARVRVQASVDRRLAKKAKSDEQAKLEDSKARKAKAAPHKPKKTDSKPKSDGKVKSRSDGKVKSKSDGKVKARRRRALPPRRTNPIPLIGAAVLAGGLLGVGVMVAMRGDTHTDVAVAPTPEPTPPAVTPVANIEVKAKAKKDKRLRAALEFALSSSTKLRELDKERAALEILDEFLTAHGDVEKAVKARGALMKHCKTVLEEQGAQAKRLAKRGDDVAAAHMVANLRGRLPASLLPKINALAVAVRGTKGEAKPEVQLASAEAIEDDAEETVEPVAVAVADEAEEESTPPPAPTWAKAPAKKASAKRTPKKVTPAPVAEDEAEDEDLGGLDDLEDEDLGGLDDLEDDAAGYDTTSPVAEALAEMVNVPHKLRKNGEFSVDYSMLEGGETEDFDSRNFDKFEISTMEGVSAASRSGLECGAGSQRLAKFQHVVPLDGGDFEIELQMWLNYSNTRSVIVFLLGKKYGVNFGQQIVKVSKKGKLKSLSPHADRNMFRENRLVKVSMKCVDGVLTIKCNGRKTAQKKFRGNDLRGHFGLMAKDVRMQITSLSIKGTLDTSGL